MFTTASSAQVDSNTIRRIVISSLTVTTLVGSPTQGTGFSDGVGTRASFNLPRFVALNSSGSFALVVSCHTVSAYQALNICIHHAHSSQADTNNNIIRYIDISSRTVTTFAGSPSRSQGSADGVGASASFKTPSGIVLDATGSFALVVSGVGLIRSPR